jgi:NADH-ubiquinone oxidoreductase chain 1
MTEHSAVIFVFFFLAEYASIVLICILTSILFLGGYLINITPLLYVLILFDVFSIAIITVLRETILSIASLFTDNLEN